jgi:small subunit ribosomal protein S26e
MPVKRKSRGRAKGSKGKGALVQCQGCGQQVPRDKAKRVSRRISLVDSQLYKELKQKGTYVASSTETRYYCVSCAVHRGVVKVRSKNERRQGSPKRRGRR